MTTPLFDECFRIVVGHEGVYSENPRDRGNWTSGRIGVGELKGTKYGIAAHVYPHLNIKELSLSSAKDIYYKNYWLPAGCEELAKKSGAGYALAVFDTAINSGVGRALKFAQNWKSWETYLDGRLNWLKGLDAWADFGNGWTNRIKALRPQCAAIEKKFPKGNDLVQVGSRIVYVEGGVGRLSGINRVFVNGQEIDITKDGTVEDSVSIVGDKLYVNLNTGGK